AFEKVQYGADYKLFLNLSKRFKDTAEAEAFLTEYEKALNAAGFDRTSPTEAGTNKNIAIYNEAEGKLVALDLFENSDGTVVNFDFRAE
ncbi:MAG: hypothetical protein IJG64_01735, partial [Oscillospiraceae bacterium]|nr:hypothetical protein [Oscillospiraceae bacterium]